VEIGEKLTCKDGKSRHVGERLSPDVLICLYSTTCVLPIGADVMSTRVIGQSQQATKRPRETQGSIRFRYNNDGVTHLDSLQKSYRKNVSIQEMMK